MSVYLSFLKLVVYILHSISREMDSESMSQHTTMSVLNFELQIKYHMYTYLYTDASVERSWFIAKLNLISLEPIS